MKKSSPANSASSSGKNFRFYAIVVLVFLTSLFILNLFYLNLDRAPPMQDEIGHLSDALRRFYFLKSGDWKNFIFYNRAPYPPMVKWIAALAFVTGISIKKAILSQVVFWIILGVFLYKLGDCLWDKKTAAAAVIFTFSTPYFYYSSHEFLIDVPTAAFAVAFVHFLVKSDLLMDRKYVCLAGVVFGMGMLVKWQLISFVAGAALYVGIWAVVKALKKQLQLKTILVNTSLGLFIAAVVSSIYLIPNAHHLPASLKMMNAVYVSYGAAFSEYLTLFFRYVLNVPYTFFLVIGLVYFVLKEAKTINKKTVFYNFLAGFFIQYAIWAKDPRYFLGMIPFAGLLSVFWIFKLKNRSWKIFFTVVLTITAFIQTFGWIFSTTQSLPIYTASIVANRPYNENWKTEQIVIECLDIGGRKKTAYVFAKWGDPPPKNIEPFYLFKHNFYRGTFPDFLRYPEKTTLHRQKDLLINVYSNSKNPERYYLSFTSNSPDKLRVVLKILKKNNIPVNPVLIKTYDLPDGYTNRIYRLD